jgi:hypothetical protein
VRTRSSGQRSTGYKVHLRSLPCGTDGARLFTDRDAEVTCRLCRSGTSWDEIDPGRAGRYVPATRQPAAAPPAVRHLPGRPCGSSGGVAGHPHENAGPITCRACQRCGDGALLARYAPWVAAFDVWTQARRALDATAVRRTAALRTNRRRRRERTGSWAVLSLAAAALAATCVGGPAWLGLLGFVLLVVGVNLRDQSSAVVDVPAEPRAVHHLEHAAGLELLEPLHHRGEHDGPDFLVGYARLDQPCLGCVWESVERAELEYTTSLAA